MKYTIAVNQLGIAQAGLDEHTDLIDWAILEYIRDWTINPKASRIGEKVWINYRHLAEAMPLIGVKSKSAISARISKAADLGLIETEQDQQGRLYAGLTELYHEITGFAADPEAVREMRTPFAQTNTPFAQTNTPVRTDEHSVDKQRVVEQSRKNAPPTVDSVVERYNSRFPNARQVESITTERRKKIKARIANDLTTWEDWETYFDVIAESDFLMGRVPPRNDRRPFRLSIDFLISETRCAEIREGKYD